MADSGSLGQLGNALAKRLEPNYRVIATDFRKPPQAAPMSQNSRFEYLDVLEQSQIDALVVNNDVTTIVHFSALLSAIGEREPERALRVNMNGFQHVLDIAKKHNCKVFCPSTIGAFGPSTPKSKTPDLTIMRPTTIYGITKVHMELMGEYYHQRYGLDFRSARLPGVISSSSIPGGGTTDYAVEIFHDALKSGHHKCFLSENTRLPMIYISDAIEGMHQLLHVPSKSLSQRVYNMGALDFTPAEIAAEIQKRVSLKVEYKPDFRQAIADSWPQSLDDSKARADWGWDPKVNLSKMVDIMINDLTKSMKQ